MTENLSTLVDKHGRRFTVGGAIAGLHGVSVERITRTGCFVSVALKRGGQPLPSVVLHADDVRHIG